MEPFALNPEGILERIHPRARKYFDDWIAKIYQEVPELVGIDEAQLRTDAATYLSNDERTRFNKYQDVIAKWLSKCIDITDNLSECLYSSEALESMIQFKYLLKMIYIRKDLEVVEEQLKRVEEAEAARKEQAEKAAEEQRKREEEAEAKRKDEEFERKWHAAVQAVDPPIDDAKKYLDEGEYNQFIQATGEAVRCYLKEGDEYLDSFQTSEYRCWLRKINNRKDAESQAQEYFDGLGSVAAGLKQSLYQDRKGEHTGYFQEQVNDARYIGHIDIDILSDEDREAVRSSLWNIAKGERNKLVSEDFREFIGCEPWRTYFLLPSAEYRFEGVACLDFAFDVFAVIEVQMTLTSGEISFGGREFYSKWKEKVLGYSFLIARPSDFGGSVFWQTIPLVLVKGLLNGEVKPPGATILEAPDGWIFYKIPKFEDAVYIPDSFANYLKKVGSIDQMASLGIVSEKVAGIVRGELKSGPELLVEGKVKQSWKAMALRLYDKGRRPGDPEVKSLGIKPSTAYRYYQHWKKANRSSNSI